MYKMLLEEGKKAFIRWVFVLCALVMTFLFTPLWENTAQVWNSPAVLTGISNDIKELKEDIRTIRGEDRVIQMDPFLSYVEEPYVLSAGNPVTVHYVIGRTLLGSTCSLLSITPIYTNDVGVSIAGETLTPRRQLNTASEKVVLELNPPKNLRVGRTVLTLELVFDCGGNRSVIDRTDPLVFMVVE